LVGQEIHKTKIKIINSRPDSEKSVAGDTEKRREKSKMQCKQTSLKNLNFINEDLQGEAVRRENG